MEPLHEAGLTLYETARTALQHCVDIDEVKHIQGQAEALREYARRSKDTDLQAKAIVVRLRSERRLGELLQEGHGRSQGRPDTAQRNAQIRAHIEDQETSKETIAKEHGVSEHRVNQIFNEDTEQKTNPDTKTPAPTYEELGITHKQGARAKSYARMNEEDWEASITDLEEGISKGTMRPTSNLKAVMKKAEQPPPTWAKAIIYERNWKDTNEPEIIRADTEAHIFLWTPTDRLPDGLAHLQDTIGARYSCLFAWKGKGTTKDQQSLILYGRIGSPKFASTKDFKIAYQAEDGRQQLETTLRRVTDQPPIVVEQWTKGETEQEANEELPL